MRSLIPSLVFAPLGACLSCRLTRRFTRCRRRRRAANVTAVVQVGLPASLEQYIHRLGRTARAGATTTAQGKGIIVLAPFESFFLRRLSSLPLQPHPLGSSALAPGSPAVEQARADLARAAAQVDDETKGQFYAASLGFYKGFLRDAFRGNAGEMVALWNDFATRPAAEGGLGCAEVPGSASSFHSLSLSLSQVVFHKLTLARPPHQCSRRRWARCRSRARRGSASSRSSRARRAAAAEAAMAGAAGVAAAAGADGAGRVAGAGGVVHGAVGGRSEWGASLSLCERGQSERG